MGRTRRRSHETVLLRAVTPMYHWGLDAVCDRLMEQGSLHRLLSSAPMTVNPTTARIALAYRLALGRQPMRDEQQDCAGQGT